MEIGRKRDCIRIYALCLLEALSPHCGRTGLLPSPCVYVEALINLGGWDGGRGTSGGTDGNTLAVNLITQANPLTPENYFEARGWEPCI